VACKELVSGERCCEFSCRYKDASKKFKEHVRNFLFCHLSTNRSPTFLL
jgi:hypothetical protein